jgi:hypothetical protein
MGKRDDGLSEQIWHLCGCFSVGYEVFFWVHSEGIGQD